MERPEPSVLYVAGDLSVGKWKNVCLAIWRDKPTIHSARELKRHYVALAKEHPRGFLAFGAIEAGVANPDEAERKAISEAMDAVKDKLLGSAVVLEATGFVAAATRAALAAMSMLTASRFPRKFFASLDEAATWAAPLVPEVGDGAALSAVFVDFRERANARTSR